MKYSEMLNIIDQVITNSRLSNSIETNNWERIKEMEEELSFQILEKIEEAGMFYCPVEKFGEIGTLRTPKGWEDETE